jgi:hypothetical protein
VLSQVLAIGTGAQVAQLMLAYGPHGGDVVITVATTFALAAMRAAHDGIAASQCPGGGDGQMVKFSVALPGGCACVSQRLAFIFAQQYMDYGHGLIEVAGSTRGVEFHLEFGCNHVAKILHDVCEDGSYHGLGVVASNLAHGVEGVELKAELVKAYDAGGGKARLD